MEKVKWAVVGIGTEEKPGLPRKYVHQLEGMVGAEVAVVISQDGARARSFQNSYFPQALPGDWGDLERYLDAGNVEAIWLATPPETHRKLVTDVIKWGAKAILCEKPMAPTLKDALEMERAARESGTILVINQMLVHHPAVIQLRQIQQKEGWGCPVRVDVAVLKNSPREGWRLSFARSGGGVAADLCPHWFPVSYELGVQYPLTVIGVSDVIWDKGDDAVIRQLLLALKSPHDIRVDFTLSDVYDGNHLDALVLNYSGGQMVHLNCSGAWYVANTSGCCFKAQWENEIAPLFARSIEYTTRLILEGAKFDPQLLGALEAMRVIEEVNKIALRER